MRLLTWNLYHFDPYTKALSKLARGFERDLADVGALVALRLVDPDELRELYSRVGEDEFLRYPALDRYSLDDAVAALEARS